MTHALLLVTVLLLGGGDAEQTNGLRGSNASGTNITAESVLDSTDLVANEDATGAGLNTNISNSSTLEASWLPFITGGKILLGRPGRFTGLCLSHEDNWVSANRVKATACYDGNDQLWTVRDSEIKSYSQGRCLDYDTTFVTKGRVNVWTCHGRQNQKWTFSMGLTKSLYDNRCLQYNMRDQYVYMAACNVMDTNQQFYLQQ